MTKEESDALGDAGWRPVASILANGWVATGEFVSAFFASGRALLQMPSIGAGSRFEGEVTWLTDDAWPTTLTI